MTENARLRGRPLGCLWVHAWGAATLAELARWPHPSPWWGQRFWPVVIGWVLPGLVVAVVVDGLISNWREDRRDDKGTSRPPA